LFNPESYTQEEEKVTYARTSEKDIERLRIELADQVPKRARI